VSSTPLPCPGGRGDGDADLLARIAGEAGEHRFHQIRHQELEVVAARAGLGRAFEHRLAVRGALDVHVEEAGEDGVDVDIVIARAPEGIVPAIIEWRAEASAIAEARVVRPVETPWAVAEAAIAAEAGGRADLLPAVVDAVFERNDERRGLRRGRLGIALREQVPADEVGIM